MTPLTIGPLTLDLDAIPALVALRGVPQPAEHHPEGDVFTHVMLALEQACKLTDDWTVHLAVLLHDLGKGVTPREEWPQHKGHEERGVQLVLAAMHDIRKAHPEVDLATFAPAIDLAERVCRFHLHCHRAGEMGRPALRRLFVALKAVEEPAQFERFLLACEADARGRTGFEDRDYPQPAILRAEFALYQDHERTEDIRLGLKREVDRHLGDKSRFTPEQHRALREKTAELVAMIKEMTR